MTCVWDLRPQNVTYGPREASLRIRMEMDANPTSQITVKRNVAGEQAAWAFGKEFIAPASVLPAAANTGTRRRVFLYPLG
jgi:hypothetical protein